jgi:hypothetical protein
MICFVNYLAPGLLPIEEWEKGQRGQGIALWLSLFTKDPSPPTLFYHICQVTRRADFCIIKGEFFPLGDLMLLNAAPSKQYG